MSKKKNAAARAAPDQSALEEKRYTVKEIAERFDLSEWTVQTYLRKGRIVAAGGKISGDYIIGEKRGNSWRVRESELIKFQGRLEGREASS